MQDESHKQNINDQAYTNYAIYMRLDNYITHMEKRAEEHDKRTCEKDTELTKRLDEIISAQKYTNGSVRDLLLWREYVKGQIWVVPLIVTSVISGLVGLAFKFKFF